MNFMSYRRNVEGLVPEVNFGSAANQAIIRSNLSNARKIQLILCSHFKAKNQRQTTPQCILAKEANRIHSLFPTLAFTNILALLTSFQDLPDRVEVVLRFMLHCMGQEGGEALLETRKLKRGAPFQDLQIAPFEDFEISEKLRKVSECEPSTSTAHCNLELNYEDYFPSHSKARSCTVTSAESTTAPETCLSSATASNRDQTSMGDLTENGAVTSSSAANSEPANVETVLPQSSTLENNEIPPIQDSSVDDIEMYLLDLPHIEDPSAPVSSTDMVGTPEHDENGAVEVDNQEGVGSSNGDHGAFDNVGSSVVGPADAMPSTSKQYDLDEPKEFDLVAYVREITSSPPETIERRCKKLNLPTNVKPEILVLQKLINDLLLSMTVDSEDSDQDRDLAGKKRSKRRTSSPAYAPEPELPPEDQFEILKGFLPDADPDYLRMICDKYAGQPDSLRTFLEDATERRNYPTMRDYQRRQQLSAQQKQYTSEFTVENFIKVIPDPVTFFADPARKLQLSAIEIHYAMIFFRNWFNKLSIRTIQSVFNKNGHNIGVAIMELEGFTRCPDVLMKSVRKKTPLPNNVENIPLLQELAYYAHKDEIDSYLKQQKDKEYAEREEAKNQGLLQTCTCCYDEEVLLRDIYRCERGCEFCKDCIIKSTEVRFGEGKLDFPCLMNCEAAFSLQILQAVLSPKLFSKIAQKKALEEIKSAGIEELEMCPFCDFATIPAEGYTIFTCMNPECMKESCRMCKEPSHVPLRCDEIEKDADVKARTFLENKMTEALLRKCYKCGVKFFKEEGCNMMTCSCGAHMCYVCGQPAEDYKHFNGQGGDRVELCPLYSNNRTLNKNNVIEGAKKAKAEIGNVTLKHDPTAGLNLNKRTKQKRKSRKARLRDREQWFGDLGDNPLVIQAIMDLDRMHQHLDRMQQHS